MTGWNRLTLALVQFRMRECLKKLNDQDHQALLLYFGLGGKEHSFKGVAQKLNVTEARAGQILVRARRRLVRLMFPR